MKIHVILIVSEISLLKENLKIKQVMLLLLIIMSFFEYYKCYEENTSYYNAELSGVAMGGPGGPGPPCSDLWPPKWPPHLIFSVLLKSLNLRILILKFTEMVCFGPFRPISWPP